MVGVHGCFHAVKHTPVIVPCRSPPVSRAAAVTVHANKLIKGANRPASSKKGGGASKSHTVELNLQKLVCDSSYIPTRQVGAVEVAAKAGMPAPQRGTVSCNNTVTLLIFTWIQIITFSHALLIAGKLSLWYGCALLMMCTSCLLL